MIPLTRDVAALVGEWAEGVENRSLLHEKFALPKVWGVEEGAKLNDAGRWSVLRIVTRGADLLRGDAQRLRREASGRNARPDVADRKEREAHVAEKMVNIGRVDAALARVGSENAVRFLADVGKSFQGQVVTFEATLGSRMMVNLAGGVVENAGIALAALSRASPACKPFGRFTRPRARKSFGCFARLCFCSATVPMTCGAISDGRAARSTQQTSRTKSAPKISKAAPASSPPTLPPLPPSLWTW
jgi:hypothetical protein